MNSMMIFSVTYSDSEYMSSDEYESLVIAGTFEEAMTKWRNRFYNKPNARLKGVKIFWEFPII